MKIDYIALARQNRKIAVAGLAARKQGLRPANVHAFTPRSNAHEPITPVFTSMRNREEKKLAA